MATSKLRVIIWTVALSALTLVGCTSQQSNQEEPVHLDGAPVRVVVPDGFVVRRILLLDSGHATYCVSESEDFETLCDAPGLNFVINYVPAGYPLPPTHPIKSRDLDEALRVLDRTHSAEPYRIIRSETSRHDTRLEWEVVVLDDVLNQTGVAKDVSDDLVFVDGTNSIQLGEERIRSAFSDLVESIEFVT
jgi:hypothetical protein